MDKLQFPPSRIKIKFNVSDSGGGVGLIRVYQEGKLIQTIGQGQIKRQSANLDEILAQDKLDIKGKTENLMLIAQADINKSMSGTQTTDDIVAKQVLDTTTNKAGEYS